MAMNESDDDMELEGLSSFQQYSQSMLSLRLQELRQFDPNKMVDQTDSG